MQRDSSDSEIDWAGVCAGVPAARGALWRRHWGRVYAIAARILGPGAEAEDVAQDVLVDFVLRRAETLERPEAAPAYLRLATVRRCLRLQKRRRLFAADEPSDPVDATATEELHRRGEDVVLLGRLDRCLGKLRPKAREVVRLRYRGDLTNQNIGELVGGSKQYIGRLLRKTLEQLRDCLERGNAEGAS